MRSAVESSWELELVDSSDEWVKTRFVRAGKSSAGDAETGAGVADTLYIYPERLYPIFLYRGRELLHCRTPPPVICYCGISNRGRLLNFPLFPLDLAFLRYSMTANFVQCFGDDPWGYGLVSINSMVPPHSPSSRYVTHR